MASNFVTQINATERAIKSVTVFKSSQAEVVRTFTVDLHAGQNTIKIRSLPSTIDTDSVRVTGLGEARLLDVVCTVASNESDHDQKSSPEIIRVLGAKKMVLEAEKHVLGHQADILVGYGKSLTGENITHSSMAVFLESFLGQGRRNAAAVSALDEEILALDRQIEKELVKQALKKGETKRQVTVVVAVEESGPVELKLTYIVSNASWTPTYELHATTENGSPSSSVSLHYRARICQSTGEDWTNTALTLSTVASDVMARVIPTLWPIKIQQRSGFARYSKPGLFGQQPSTGFVQTPGGAFGQLTPAQPAAGAGPPGQPLGFGQTSGGAFAAFGQTSGGAFGGGALGKASEPAAGGLFGTFGTAFQPSAAPAAFGGSLFGVSGPAPVTHPTVSERSHDAVVNSSEGDESSFEEVAVPGPFAAPTTIVSESSLAISYSVEGNSTVPSDGEAHQVSVAVLPFEAKVMHVAIPRSQARVYLQCKVKNTSEYSLLPGLVTVILDDSYVSKTSIQHINKGDTFNCTLGIDSATQISYLRNCCTVKANTGTFAEDSNISTYTTKITIYNKHAFGIDLAVRDVIPLCDDKRVKIILKQPEGLADAVNGEVVDLKKDDNSLKVGWEQVVDGKGGEQDGKYEWLCRVDAGSQVKLEAEWTVKAPSDTMWVEALVYPSSSWHGKFST